MGVVLIHGLYPWLQYGRPVGPLVVLGCVGGEILQCHGELRLSFGGLVRVVGLVTWRHLRGSKRECVVYRGFTPADTNMPPPNRCAYRDRADGACFGGFLWLCIRICWMGRIGWMKVRG